MQAVLRVVEQVRAQGAGHGAGAEEQRALLEAPMTAGEPDAAVGDHAPDEAQAAESRTGHQPSRAGHTVVQAADHHGDRPGCQCAAEDRRAVVEHGHRQPGAVQAGRVEERQQDDEQTERLGAGARQECHRCQEGQQIGGQQDPGDPQVPRGAATR
jgi:hypothetical protein